MFGVCKSDQSVPIEQLDYKFIGSCKDVELLQKLLKILRYSLVLLFFIFDQIILC